MKKTLTRVLSLVLVLAMFVSAVPLALADDPEPVALTGIALSIGNGGLIAVPNSTIITAAKEPSNATSELDLEWSSDNESVATVDQNGEVTGVSYGTATITATQKNTQISGTVTVTVKHKPALSGGATKNLTVGDKVSLPEVVVNGLTEGTQYSVAWEIGNNEGNVVELVGTTEVKALKAGTATLNATITPVAPVTSDNLTGTTLTLTVNVAAAQPTSYTAALSSDSLTLTVGEEKDLPAIQGLDGLTPGTHYTFVWTEDDAEISLNDAKTKVKGEAAGSGTLKLTITPAEGVNITGTELTCTVTVNPATKFTPALKDADKKLTVAYGGEIDLPSIAESMTGLTEGTDYTVSWESDAPTVAKVEGTKIKGLAVGKAKLTGTVALTKSGVSLTEGYKLECEITVSAGITMEISGSIAMTKGESYTLPVPTLKGEGYSNLEVVSYTYTRITDDAENTKLETVSGKQVLTGRSTGRDSFTLTAVVKHKTTKVEVAVPPITVYASVYAEVEDITVVLKDTVKSFIFTEEGVMSALKLGSTDVLSTHKTLAALLLDMNVDHTTDRHPDEMNYRLQFDSITADGGSLSDADGLQNVLQKPISMKYLKRYKFTKDENKLAKSKFEYVVYDDEKLPIMTGTLYIDYAGTSEITYTTDFETPVTFREEDFEKFWAEYGTDKKLSYVTFNSFPSVTYGTLYTDTYETTKVNKNMKFIADYYRNSAFYDLDTVTFTPVLRSAAYTITIPFTAVDASNGTVNGTVSINVSKGSKLTITNLGLRLGQTGATLDDVIAADFKKANNDEVLDYLTFVLPEVEEGRLVYDFNRNYDTLLTAEDVLATDKLYYNPGASENVLDLAEVWFFPAAGASGNIKLAYSAVGEEGSVYEGFITLSVSVKSKSQYFNDVKSGSYSWAADAVDFLRYHGVVNGTNADNTTFSPANSITRAHFMLMLYRAFLADEYSDFNVTSNFPDIPKGTDSYSRELYQAVGVAKYLGITNGSDGKYLPNKNISREEAMTLIYRTLNILDLDLEYTSSNRTSNFSDYNKVSAYAKDPLKYLIEHGVVLGTEGKINPKSNITRAEMAVILHRVLTY